MTDSPFNVEHKKSLVDVFASLTVLVLLNDKSRYLATSVLAMGAESDSVLGRY
jgi:hypothetical protein